MALEIFCENFSAKIAAEGLEFFAEREEGGWLAWPRQLAGQAAHSSLTVYISTVWLHRHPAFAFAKPLISGLFLNLAEILA